MFWFFLHHFLFPLQSQTNQLMIPHTSSLHKNMHSTACLFSRSTKTFKRRNACSNPAGNYLQCKAVIELKTCDVKCSKHQDININISNKMCKHSCNNALIWKTLYQKGQEKWIPVLQSAHSWHLVHSDLISIHDLFTKDICPFLFFPITERNTMGDNQLGSSWSGAAVDIKYMD